MLRTNLLKWLIVVASLVPFIWLSVVSSVPSGEKTITWTAGDSSPFIQSPLPGERVSEVKDGADGKYVTIENEPVYMAVFPPSDDFTSATVTMEFDPNKAFAVELGGLTNVAAYAFDFHALSNKTVESLSWNLLKTTSADGLMVFAKNDVKAGVADFLAYPPDRSTVATYRSILPGVYRDDVYSPINSTQTFDVSLRGSHQYLTYIKNETFKTSITYQDINRTFGADDGYVRVYNEVGTKMIEKKIVDDGDTSEGQFYSTRIIDLVGDNWPEGVYRTELSGTSDIIWRQFVTNQRYLTFKNRLFVADDVGYLATDRKTNFVTNSKIIAIETLHANPKHTVTIGLKTIPIPNGHWKVYHNVTEEGVVGGVTSSGDVKLTGEAKFALTKTSFFDPDARSLTVNTNIDDPSLQYILANVPPIKLTADGWRTASAVFDLADLVKEFKAYKFAISLPGLAVDGESIDLHRVTIDFHKEPISWWSAIKLELRRWKGAVIERL